MCWLCGIPSQLKRKKMQPDSDDDGSDEDFKVR